MTPQQEQDFLRAMQSMAESVAEIRKTLDAMLKQAQGIRQKP